ncbi:MAG: energy-coupling factor transporter ATPase [Acidaminococcaceae bacterium]|nr:energy-coupling factor transporter ATPase [Acidaminococcaceae bacterium]HBX75697.1 energy-coupling factor transporter ATPase [Acidaminococcaceae bacterium]
MEPVIETQGLKHVYIDADNNQVTALDGIDLQIMPGEFVAIIGANGSGKSTLARHFNALLLPTEGNVEVHGLDTLDENNLWTIRQNTGMVFQNPDNQIVAAVVEEDVAFGPENIGVPAEELRVRVEEALRAVDMLEYREHAPHLLSGGQKQRVAIAGTLALGSDCIILDEPTAMLDPKGRKEILNTVLKLNKEQHITVVYITHFMTEAMRADRVIVMSDGRVMFQGTPKEVFSRVDELEKLGLEAPLAAKFAFELRKSGIKLPQGIITNEELAEALAN